MSNENLVESKKYSLIDSIKTGAIMGFVFSAFILFTIYSICKITLA